MFKLLMINRLQARVRQYFAAHPEVRLVVVVGSTDKAMTRRAVGTVLAEQFRVRLHDHRHGDPRLMTPLAILGITPPKNPRSLVGWIRVYMAARQRVNSPADVDVIVQELVIKRPGDMADYASYLQPHVAIVTSVATEHMKSFASMDMVAAEYLAAGDMAQLIVINRDKVDSVYAQFERNANLTTYGGSDLAEYWVEAEDIYSTIGTPIMINGPEFEQPLEARVQLVGSDAILPVVASIVVATKFGLTPETIARGIERIVTLPGRMNPLRGIGDALILDDTYRSHPSSAMAGLQTLYEFDTAPQRIAVLSTFHDLGDMTESEHQRIGELCNPDLLAWVVLVGPQPDVDTMAAAARGQGCQVKVCRDAIIAGEFVRSVTERGAVILVEGAGPDTYLEECTKILCELSEEPKLVRQGEDWRSIKNEHFSQFDN